MKAAIITSYGGPEVLRIEEVEAPRPGAGEILVRVHASGLNRADLLQRRGKYAPPKGAPEKIPGLEFAGEVVEVGNGAKRWKPGDRVFGLTPGGAHAEFLAVPETSAARIPDNLDWVQAAAAPEVFITAHDALQQARFRAADRVLIHAVASGVGLAAIQLVRVFGGVPYGTSRTPDKLQRAAKLGLEAGFCPGEDLAGLAEWGLKVTQDHGFDVCLDLAGGPYVGATIGCMALKGRMILIGTMAGPKAELPLGAVLFKRLQITGTVMRARSTVEISEVIRDFEAEVVPLMAAARLDLSIDKLFKFNEIAEAHAFQESNQTFGKVVIDFST
jgi:putative PIG3 family NAD(P)H quinone oxidoreductase